MSSKLIISNASLFFSIVYESKAGRYMQGDVQLAMRTSLKHSSALNLPSTAVAPFCGLFLGPSPGALVTTGEQIKGSAMQLWMCQRGYNIILQMHEVYLWLQELEGWSQLSQHLVHTT